MLCGPASAASRADRDQCADLNGLAAVEQIIAACTRVLDDSHGADQPADAEVYLARGNAHAARRDYDRAIADYGAAIQLMPAMAMAYNNRGVARRNKGDFAGAIADYGEAIRLAPNLAIAYRNRGRALRNGDELAQAIADFDAAIRLDPKDAGSYASRCWARAVAGRDLARALADCNESLRLRPGDHDTLNSRALVQLKRDAPELALADYAAALAQDANDADSLFGRGIARLRLGDRKGGEADIAAAGAMMPDIVETYVSVGAVTGAAAGPAAQDATARDYQLAAQIGTRAAWEAFLKQYPAGYHADLARAQLEKLGAAAPETTGAIDAPRQENKLKDRLAREPSQQEKPDALRQTVELGAPPATVPARIVSPLSGGELVTEIKKGLAQVGCYTGPIDDRWKTASTRSALKIFVAAVHLPTATDQPSNELLDAVRGSTGQVCGAACGPREVKRKGECVAKTCPGKLVLADDGKCVKPGDMNKHAAVPLPRPAPIASREKR